MVSILESDVLIWCDSSDILLSRAAIANAGLLQWSGRPLHSVTLLKTMAAHHILELELLADLGFLEV